MTSASPQAKPDVIAWMNVDRNGIMLDATIHRDQAEELAEDEGNSVVGLCCVDDTEKLIDAKDREIASLKKRNDELLQALRNVVVSAKLVYINSNGAEMYLVDPEAINEVRRLSINNPEPKE